MADPPTISVTLLREGSREAVSSITLRSLDEQPSVDVLVRVGSVAWTGELRLTMLYEPPGHIRQSIGENDVTLRPGVQVTFPQATLRLAPLPGDHLVTAVLAGTGLDLAPSACAVLHIWPPARR